VSDSKAILEPLNPTPSYPTSLPEIVASLPSCEELEGIQKPVLDELALKYDWTKKEITPENAVEYSAWLKWRLRHKKVARGKNHYKSRRLRMRLKNYERDDELKRLQQAYRDSIYGKWVFKKKLCKQRKVEFNVTYEEYEHWLVSLGNIPGVGTPYWKSTTKHPKLGLKINLIDKEKPFQKDNVYFTYDGKFLLNASDISEPNVNEGV
jgi:hypothetical protein